MPRTGRIRKRLLNPDSVYNNRLVTRLINRVMSDGKKSIAEKQVYRSLELIKEKTGQDPIKFLEQAINNVAPKMEVRPRRVGGASYQVPVEVKGDRKFSLAIRWVINAARKRSNREHKTFAEKLAAEMIDISQNQGEAIKKRDTAQRMADANKAFAHFRW